MLEDDDGMINTGSRYIKRRATAAKKDRKTREIAFIKIEDRCFGRVIRMLICGYLMLIKIFSLTSVDRNKRPGG